MQDLLAWVRTDPGIHAEALPIFRAALENPQDAWTSSSAARGVESLAGPQEGRRAWLALLHHPRADIVAHTALQLEDASYVPALLELLRRRPDTNIHTAVIRTLGRIRDPATLPVIVEHLAIPELRANAAEALADLGDPRAIPHLEPLLNDNTEAWPDDRGWMLRVGDVAAGAIRRLNAPPRPRPTAASSESVLAPSRFSADADHSYFASSIRPISTYVAYVPLAAAVFEFPWVIAVLFSQLFRTGAIARSHAETRLLDAFSLMPALAGLVTGIIVIARGPRRRLRERACLYVGCLACALFVLWFGGELIR